jgi:hypothetical protein
MTRDEAVKLAGVLKRTAISFHESRTDDALIRALDAEDALIAALTAPAAGEDVELVHALEEAIKSDLLGGTTARPALTQTARTALLSRIRAVPDGWLPMQTLVHQHINDKPLTVDGKIVPATYTSDPVILTNGKRVWVERSVIMGGALSSSADKFTAYPSGDKPTHWMPLPAAPAPEKGVG